MLRRWIVVGCAVISVTAGLQSLLVAQVASSGTELTVVVADRALDTPMAGVRVRVSKGGVDKATGITGPKGSVTFQGLELGAVRVLSEREGYVRRPETTDTSIRVGANAVRVTLLAEARDGEYFRQAGTRIDAEGVALPRQEREAFFQREWDRAKLLKSEYQIPLVLEMKTGRDYLAKDDTFQSLMNMGKLIG